MTGLPPLSNIYDPYDAGIQAPTYFTASMSHLEGQEGHSRLKAGILKQGAARSFPPTLVPLEIDMMCHPCVLAELGHVALASHHHVHAEMFSYYMCTHSCWAKPEPSLMMYWPRAFLSSQQHK
eukprot:scaffold120508_cov21-Tisochrysis_lutea.AAC.1